MLIGLSVACAVIIADQLTKYWILDYILNTYQYIKITPFFNLVNAWNTGVSFSMFSNGGMIGKYLLLSGALLIVVWLLLWLRKEKSALMQTALGLIIGGAVGNMIDRARLGAVFDFLDFYIGDYHWPAFNLADSAICIGAGILIIDNLFLHKGEKKQ